MGEAAVDPVEQRAGTGVAAPQGASAPDSVDVLAERLAALEARVDAVEPEDATSIVCFSGEWDRLIAAFVIANGAAAMGQTVHLFLTFWGAAALRDADAPAGDRSLLERLIGRMVPAGPRKARLSRMHWFGFGKRFFEWRMRRKGVPQLQELMTEAIDLGVHVHLCEMSADLLGLRLDDFKNHGDVDHCGVATFLRDASRGRLAMFI